MTAHEVPADEMLAHEVLAREAPAHEVPAHEIHAYEALAHEVLTYKALAHEMLVHEMLAHEMLSVLNTHWNHTLVTIHAHQVRVLQFTNISCERASVQEHVWRTWPACASSWPERGKESCKSVSIRS